MVDDGWACACVCVSVCCVCVTVTVCVCLSQLLAVLSDYPRIAQSCCPAVNCWPRFPSLPSHPLHSSSPTPPIPHLRLITSSHDRLTAADCIARLARTQPRNHILLPHSSFPLPPWCSDLSRPFSTDAS